MDQTSNLDYGDKQSMADSSHLIDPMQQVNIDEPADFLKAGGQSKVSTTTHPSSLASMPNVSFASIELPLNEKQPLDLDSPGTPISVNVSDEIQVKQATTAWGRFRSRLQFSNMGLGCFAFWMCGIVFGLVAILLEFKSRYLQQSGSANNHKTAQQLRKASRIVSVVGITIGTVVAITVTCIKVIPILVHIQRSAYWARCLPGSYEFDPEQTSGTRCFAHTSRAFSCNTCMSIGGIYYYDQCYYKSNYVQSRSDEIITSCVPAITSIRSALIAAGQQRMVNVGRANTSVTVSATSTTVTHRGHARDTYRTVGVTRIARRHSLKLLARMSKVSTLVTSRVSMEPSEWVEVSLPTATPRATSTSTIAKVTRSTVNAFLKSQRNTPL
jgi:hypothetical protein